MSLPAKASIDLARVPEGDGDELDPAVDLALQEPRAPVAGELLEVRRDRLGEVLGVGGGFAAVVRARQVRAIMARG